MSMQAPSATLHDLRAAQAVIRGEPINADDLAHLLRVDRRAAERLLQPGVHTPALKLAVLLCLVSRLRGTDATRDEVCDAIEVHRLLQRVEATTPAPGLTLDELRAAEALLRGQDADIGASCAFLRWSPVAVRHLILVAGDSCALDSMLIAILLLRLHGRRADLEELRRALTAVIRRETAALRRAGAH